MLVLAKLFKVLLFIAKAAENKSESIKLIKIWFTTNGPINKSVALPQTNSKGKKFGETC